MNFYIKQPDGSLKRARPKTAAEFKVQYLIMHYGAGR